jgi:hypothetical protein
LIFANPAYQGKKLFFLDVGGRDGELDYLMSDKGNFETDERMRASNRVKFEQMYGYYGLDIEPAGENVLFGDICSLDFQAKYPEKMEFFDVIYSDNVFEHLEKPWIAVDNINFLLKRGRG